jgi:hypothetical protein
LVSTMSANADPVTITVSNGRRVAYSFCRSRSTRTTSPPRHPRILASPRRRSCRSVATELLVIDLIAQQSPQADVEHRAQHPLERQLVALPVGYQRRHRRPCCNLQAGHVIVDATVLF